MKSKNKQYKINRFDLINAILASESLDDPDMNDTLVALYTSMVLEEQKRDRFISNFSIPKQEFRRISSFLTKAKNLAI